MKFTFSRATLVLVSLVGTVAVGLLLAVLPAKDIAASESASAPEPTSVTVMPMWPTTRYEVRRTFSGRIEPRQTVDLAFDEPGRVDAVTVEDGDTVKAGEILVRLDVELLQIERGRLTRLLETARDEERVFEGSVEREESLARQDLAVERTVEANRVSLAQSRGRRADLEGRISQLDARIRRASLAAPFDGHVTSRHVDPGSFVAAGQPIVQVIEAGPSELRIGVDGSLAARLEPGQPVAVELASGSATAHVVAVLPNMDPLTQTRTVLLNLPESTGAVSGAIATIELVQDVEAPGVEIPLSALRDGPRGLWEIMVAVSLDAGYRVAVEAIEIIHVGRDTAYVRGTFQPGALLIVEGQHRLVPGQSVAVLP